MTRPDELRLEAAQKRQELVETLDQLIARTDLRARAAHAVHGERRPVVLAAAAAGGAVVLLAAVLAGRAAVHGAGASRRGGPRARWGGGR
ncbi:DUF3618 domain-containing protein [Streptomyces sp. CC77]|uniref:DUF3618 domain-containing protein n=1 Tax=Streptomyces sp. CC77 TaxID=1906739 RepID=UPI0008DCE890|nr:DUF3618 domain-containing protein [Streptomyces sp. CC77]OII59721.1 hypothetical protein BJP39_11615 [Streptomyces sp. CC77]